MTSSRRCWTSVIGETKPAPALHRTVAHRQDGIAELAGLIAQLAAGVGPAQSEARRVATARLQLSHLLREGLARHLEDDAGHLAALDEAAAAVAAHRSDLPGAVDSLLNRLIGERGA